MRDTDYATELATAEHNTCRIERLYVKRPGPGVSPQEEIRFSWWKNGNMVNRPMDLPEDELLVLLEKAINNGVFGGNFLTGLLRLLAEHAEFPGRG
jgi:hypothetical protein